MNQRLAALFQDSLFDSVSLEAADGALEELEYIFYGKLTDLSQLNQAESAERQEQWSVFFKSETGVEGNFRVRETNGDHYELTAKFYMPGNLGKWELDREVEKKHFEAIKEVATGGFRKDRYKFPIPHSDLCWEVDVHYDDEGNQLPWVRIELEVPAKLDTIPPLPIEFEETIMRQPKHQTDEERAFVQDLYQNVYTLTPPKASNEDLDGEDAGVVQTPDGDEPVEEENDEEVRSDDEELNQQEHREYEKDEDEEQEEETEEEEESNSEEEEEGGKESDDKEEQEEEEESKKDD